MSPESFCIKAMFQEAEQEQPRESIAKLPAKGEGLEQCGSGVAHLGGGSSVCIDSP